MRRLRIAVMAIGALATPCAAQLPTSPQGEFRADAYYPRATLAGVGLAFPAGLYTRFGATIAAGASFDGPTSAIQRADVTARFLLDPLRQFRRAPYAAAGVSVFHARDGAWRQYLMVRIGIEGPQKGGVLPAFELGLGGGAHASVVIRSGRARGR